VWDQLIGSLAQSFFVINNIEKESRILNVSFSTSQPERYVDCGTSHRDFSYGSTAESYTYNVAESSSFKVASRWGPANNLPVVLAVSRQANLEGRANIYVAPHYDQTIVSVNAKYVLTITTSGAADGYNAFGTLVQQDRLPRESSSLSFTTLEPARAQWGPGGEWIECRTRGVLEGDVLSRAAGPADQSSHTDRWVPPDS